MRTTLTLDEDVAQKARELMRRRRLPFKQVINEALRVGLSRTFRDEDARPYETQPRAMGLRPGVNLDNIAEVLADLEGDDHR